MKNIVWISFEEDYPSWSNFVCDRKGEESIDEYINSLIKTIEWASERKVKAIKIVSVDNKIDPIYQVVK